MLKKIIESLTASSLAVDYKEYCNYIDTLITEAEKHNVSLIVKTKIGNAVATYNIRHSLADLQSQFDITDKTRGYQILRDFKLQLLEPLKILADTIDNAKWEIEKNDPIVKAERDQKWQEYLAAKEAAKAAAVNRPINESYPLLLLAGKTKDCECLDSKKKNAAEYAETYSVSPEYNRVLKKAAHYRMSI